MKKYYCYKVDGAMKIDTMSVLADGSATLVGDDKEEHFVSKRWMERHKPEVGGYVVRFEDGCDSYSPATAFESSYTAFESSYTARENGEPSLLNPLVSELLTLLDSIEVECEVGFEDPSLLAKERFVILEKYGAKVKFGIPGSAEKH